MQYLNVQDWIDKDPYKKDPEPYIIEKGKKVSLATGKDIEEISEQIGDYSTKELNGMNLKPIRYIVDGFIPTGVCILSAPPKTGKSWFAFDLGLSVARGRSFLGYNCNKGNVLYLALEDSWNRLQSRLKKLLVEEEAPDNMRVAIESKRLDNGLMEQIEQMMQKQPFSLIIIDTLQRVKPPSKANKTAYEEDYAILSNVAKFAKEHDMSILFIHHNRKSNGLDTDPFENILGSTALQGATDAMYVINKPKRDEKAAILYAAGRDINGLKLHLEFDNDTCKWKNNGDYQAMLKKSMEEEYNQHPAIITLKYKLQSIIEDDGEGIKEYVVTARDFRNDTMEHTKRLIGTSEQAFMREVERFDPYLLIDGISHLKPAGVTSFRGRKGKFHRYKGDKKA